MEIDEFLAHHGVKGQKWGIRHKPMSTPKPRSEDSRIANEIRKRPRHTLTNKELQTFNTRMNLERQFNQLNPDKIKAGKKFVNSIGLNVARSLLTAAVSTAATLAIKKLFKKN